MSKLQRARNELKNIKAERKAVGQRIGEFGLESVSAAIGGGLLSGVAIAGVPGAINYALGAASAIVEVIPTKKKWPHMLGSVGRGAFYAQLGVVSASKLGGTPMLAWANLTKESDA